jgi:hypothetical protein
MPLQSCSNFRPLRAALILLLLMTPAVEALAQGATDGLYNVSGVEVDATADNPLAAREAALAEGRVQAFNILVDRLVAAEDRGRVPELGPAEVEPLVRDFQISDERSSATRYAATLSFRFFPDEVQAVLRDSRARYAQDRSKPLVVLPVYGGDDSAVLWEDPNPWRQAWAGRPVGEGLVPLVVPLGDLGDFGVIDVRQALALDQTRLTEIARRYQAEEALVTQAVPQGDPLNPDGLQVTTWRGTASPDVFALTRQPEESYSALLNRAVAQVAGTAAQSWKQEAVIGFLNMESLDATILFNSGRDWLDIRRRLVEQPRVNAVRLIRLTKTRADVSLEYFGDLDHLNVALRQNDLMVVAAPDGSYRVERLGYSGFQAAPSGNAPQTQFQQQPQPQPQGQTLTE